MDKNNLKPLMAVLVCGLLFTGCGTTKSLFGPETYGKELVPHDRTSFSQVSAVEDEGELKVSGRLRQRGMMRVDIPGHVEVALVDKSGVVIAAQKVAYSPRMLTGRKCRRQARFSARFSEIPPAGTMVRVSHVN